MLELVKGGEKTLRDSLGLEGVNPTKLNDSICAQLCDAGMQALERATRSAALFSYYVYMLLGMFWTSHISHDRFCSENAPGAVRVLLPLETSSSVS